MIFVESLVSSHLNLDVLEIKLFKTNFDMPFETFLVKAIKKQLF